MTAKDEALSACHEQPGDHVTLPKTLLLCILDECARLNDRVSHVEQERIGWQRYLDSVMPKPIEPNVVSSIRATKESGVNNKVNAQRHQVSESAVSRIVNGSRHRTTIQRDENAATRNS